MTSRIILPANPKVGLKMDIRILIQHPMETGFDTTRQAVPWPKT